MTVQKTLNKATAQLETSNVKEPRLDAEVLLASVLKKDRAFLYTHPEQEVSLEEEQLYKQLIKKRKTHFPLAYLTGQASFYGNIFFVTEATLIPRPETEILVEAIIKKAQQANTKTLLEIGTGSGCIAISLALHLPETTIQACDISEQALAVAKQNARNLKAPVEFFLSDLLQEVHESPEIIVANLPYLAQEDIDNSPTKDELLAEPRLALYAEKDGLALIQELIKQCVEKLSSKGLLYLELLPRQIETLRNWIQEEQLPFYFTPLQDLDGKDRFVLLEKTI